MAGAPDLFVVCKKCGSEVSPYITECPYCGTRLRKRAPKIDRGSGEAQPAEPRRRMPRPTLGPLRSGEIPGLRVDPIGKPRATIALLALSLVGYLVLSFVEPVDVALSDLGGEQWRLLTASFTYVDVWYQLPVLLAVGIYGWRLELRHGALLVIALFLAAGVGGNAVAAAVEPDPFVLGAPGAALGLLTAWALPDLLRARRGEEHDGDLLGTLVLALVLGLLPLATEEASAVAELVGLGVGAVVGALLLRTEANR
ncbi:rhomboid family intramembrane serine protease [Conexibacter sp. SYSU D00693]|uniref:rhomboid family intramembrane serine protease n=1 Tax=Conexibacter sp. SYSU D00693 TaxID=2812560 RepID=UPI00196AD48E|nr:rhomboid family intramembrane serine protease [Conexibacter sp. SYSU D00693]